MTKQNFLINPLKFSNKNEFISYLEKCDSSYIDLEIKHIYKLIDEYFLLYLEYESKLVSEIILPLINKCKKDKEKCNKVELRKTLDKTIKLGLKLQTILNQKAKEEIDIASSDNNSNRSDKTTLLKEAGKNYSLLVDKDSDFSKCPFNCVDQLLRRLINVPVMYYHNLFEITNIGNKTIDDYLLNKEKQIVPDVLVGKCEDMKTHESGECWANSYLLYSSTFIETIKLINEYYYTPREDDDTKLYKEIINDFKKEEYISISKIQRKYSIGFNKAGKILNNLMTLGLVSSPQGKSGYKVNKEKLEGLF